MATKTYRVQIGDTRPEKWHSIAADSELGAIAATIKALGLEKERPKMAYVQVGNYTHGNGAPMCVKYCELKYGS